jgi:hypothetical protein
MDFNKILKKFERAESTDERLARIDLERRKLSAEVKQREGALAQEEMEVRQAIMTEVSQPTQEEAAAAQKQYELYRQPAIRFLRLQRFLSDPKTRKSSAYTDAENEANDERLISYYMNYPMILDLFSEPVVILERLDEAERGKKATEKFIRDQEKAFQEREREAERIQREREEEQHKAELDELRKHRPATALPDPSPRP